MTKALFTEEVVARIRQMVKDGQSVNEIATAVGSTPGSIKVICSHYGISLSLPAREPPPRKIVSVTVPTTVCNYFAERAQNYHMTPGRLMAVVLSIIARDDLYRAIVDDVEHANMLRQKPKRYHRRIIKTAPSGQVSRTDGNGAAADHKDVTHPSNDGPGDLVLGKIGGGS